MTGQEILSYLRKQGFLPQINQEPPHLEATEETAASLPRVNTQPGQFQPQAIGPNLLGAMQQLAKPDKQLPTPTPKAWEPPTQKAGAIPQQDELLALSKGETSVQFSDTRMSFQQSGLIVKQRFEAVSKVADAMSGLGAAVNKIVGDARVIAEKRKRESGTWPDGFEREGDGARCPHCCTYFYGTRSAWKHVQKICPVVQRIQGARAEYRPCAGGRP